MMTQNHFVHLHVHSQYSLLDGVCRPEDLVEQAKSNHQTAIAITDHGNLYGALKFYQTAKKAGIKPIIGCEVYVARRTRKDRDGRFDRKSHHLILLCENQTGYQNLLKLVSLANLEGFYEKPRIDLELLQKYHAGLICLSGCLFGEIARLLTAGQYHSAKEKALEYQKIFGNDFYFLEIQNHGLPEEARIKPLLLRLSQETGVKLVATNDVHYVRKSDAQVQKILLSVRNRTEEENPNNSNNLDYPGNSEFYLKSTQEMTALFADIPDAVRNTVEIAERCHLEIKFHEKKLPHFSQPGTTDNQTYFRELCEKGMYKRYGTNPAPEIRERLQYEMQVIIENGFTDYFLIVWDVVRYARNQDIPVGAGRGSGAGCLCAYCLFITEIDPIAYQLLFERFLNPGRKTMPDIDLDFCIEGRQKIKDYVVRRYGMEHVAEITVFDTLKARSAIRLTGKFLHVPYPVYDALARSIDPAETIREFLQKNPDSNKPEQIQIRELLETAQLVEGLPLHVSVHAAGILITEEKITEHTPVTRNDGIAVAQYTMDILEKLGLLKIDFLGLRNLTMIREAEKAIQKSQHYFSIRSIRLDDKAVYEFLGTGQTAGLFQLESDGMRNFLIRLQPQCMEDLIAALALYRPGPMDGIETYIRNRNHPEKISYLHPILEKILHSTYGCMLYQEQVMQICREMAGYSYGQADEIRRAMAKKKKEIMQEERENFLHGAIQKQIPEQIAQQVFSQMEKFAAYAFNRSHATAYARIAYQTAYLKYHYFGHYMAALMTYAESDTKLAGYLRECSTGNLQKLRILPPDINTSQIAFVYDPDQNCILFGLTGIKGLGRMFLDKILEERRIHGIFQNLQDFCKRTASLGLHRQQLEVLIQSGALDCLNPNRKQMLLHYSRILENLRHNPDHIIDGQMSLFGEESPSGMQELPETPDFSIFEKLEQEKQAFGFYVSGHPLDEWAYLKNLLKCVNIPDLSALPDSAHVRMIGIIRSVRICQTKKKQDMCFLTLEDTSGITDIVLFPGEYSRFRERLQTSQPGNVIYLTGKKSKNSVICEQLRKGDELPGILEQMQFCIKLDSQEQLHQIQEICKKFTGKTALIFYLTNTGKYIIPRNRLAVSVTPELYETLKKILSSAQMGCIPKI
ncbi:MAG: DNA polymerase III subunit alpha [Oscillospiraceae bacterium]|nr:DNA polymerase III subunit alpha [Oscillospiraceae bacterium]